MIYLITNRSVRKKGGKDIVDSDGTEDGSDLFRVGKMGIVEEEADETLFWLELIEESALLPGERLAELKQEANEIIAITVASIKSARQT